VLRIAILDDYQGVALSMADWSPLLERAEVDSFRDHVEGEDDLADRLTPYDVVVVMRERTPLPAAVIERLPRLRLIVTTGRRNPVVDVEAARRRGIPVCGTRSLASAPVELTWALILGLARNLVTEARNVAAGRWQTTVGTDLAGRRLGVVGLGRLGGAVATVGLAFGMDVVAWSANLTAERAAEVGVTPVPFDTLLATSDVVTIHQVLSERTRGLVGARELGLMRPGALLVNTSRGPVVDTDALLQALESGTLGGAGLDVFDQEPLPADHPLRSAPRTLLTPHLGYVTEGVYRTFFGDVVEDVLAFLTGEPVRVL
jgi:phosphoglycerate dehydrogenase-like enzyme